MLTKNMGVIILDLVNLNQYLSDWIKSNAVNDENVDFSCVFSEEVCSKPEFIITKFYYLCLIEPKNSKTGLPSAMMYSSTELLDTDENGDIISSEPIDYTIVF